MATLTLRTEIGGIRPEFEVGETQERRAAATPDGSMVPRYRQINQRALRRVDLRWDVAREGQKRLLERAWNQAGSVAALNYTPVGDVDANAFEVRFTEPPTFEQLTAKTWRLAASLEEVL